MMVVLVYTVCVYVCVCAVVYNLCVLEVQSKVICRRDGSRGLYS